MYDAFLKLVFDSDPPGRQLRGGSVDARHIGWIDLETFSLEQPPPSSFARVRDSARYHDFHVTKRQDSASAGLYNHCANGTHFETAVVEIVPPSGRAMAFTFAEVMVASMTLSDRPGHDHPHESISVEFKKMSVSYGVAGAAQAAVSAVALTGAVAALAAAALRTLNKI